MIKVDHGQCAEWMSVPANYQPCVPGSVERLHKYISVGTSGND